MRTLHTARVDRRSGTSGIHRLVLTMTITASLVIAPTLALAQGAPSRAWDDRSGELPGISDGPSTGVLLAAAAVVVIGGGYLLYRANSNRTPLKLEPSHPDFRAATVRSAERQSMTLTNTGKRPQSVESVVVRGAAFSVADVPALPFTLAPGARLQFQVEFQPVEAQGYSGELEVITSDGNGKRKPLRTKLQGRGTPTATSDAEEGSSTEHPDERLSPAGAIR